MVPCPISSSATSSSGNTKFSAYKGKQVRDNLHADDVARFALEIISARPESLRS